MQAGKLPLDLLTSLLDKIEVRDPRVALGPRAGEDAALIDFGDRYLVATTDPITFATDLLGWYMVQVNANDIAVMGATPRWLLATLLLPEGTTPEQTGSIFDQIRDACSQLGIALVGGHTEVAYQLPRAVAVGAMLGEVDKQRVVRTSGARPGDAIVLTKGIAVEGTALLAREASESLRAAGIEDPAVGRASELLFTPGISVVPEAAIACDTVDVHAMHDPTEGGLATGLREMAVAAGTGVEVHADRIATLPDCRDFCSALGLDPMGLIASGSLLIALSPGDSATLIGAMEAKHIGAQEIGRFTEPEDGLRLRTAEGVRELPVFERDELARWLGG